MCLTKASPVAITITICLVCAIASPLMADMTVSMNSYGAYRQGNGGEFTFYLGQGFQPDYLDLYDEKAKPVGNAMQTFCLEMSEHIYTNRTYDVTVSNSAKNGGNNFANNAVDHMDNISNGSAWLYGQFAAGTLAGFNYAVDTSTEIKARKISGEQLQNALWALEDEKSMVSSNVFIKLLTESGQFAGIAEAKHDYLGSKVGVMNLTLNGSKAQDQIFLNPTPVPVPGSLLLAGIGTTILGFRKRKAIQ